MLVMQEYWLPFNALVAIMFPVFAFLEITRLQGFRRTGKVHRIAPLLSHIILKLQCLPAAVCIAVNAVSMCSWSAHDSFWG